MAEKVVFLDENDVEWQWRHESGWGKVMPQGASKANKISTTSFNSRDADTLAAAATFQGVGEDVSGYGRVGVAIRSDNATDGTLTIEVSHDNVIWSGPTRALADTRFSQPVMWNIVEKYFRIKYVNGSTEAANLSIQVQYSNNADIVLAHPLTETLIGELGAVLTRAVLAGQDVAGVYRNVQTIQHEGKTSLYTVSGFSDTESVHFDVQSDSASIAYMLIDLSDTTTWPHSNTNHVVIEYIVLQVDPDTNFLGSVAIGYLKNVGADNGDLVKVIDIDMRRKSDLLVETIDFGSHGLHMDDAHHFGPINANSTLFQTTGANLGGPAGGTHPSGDGDIVLVVTGADSDTVNISITIGYESVE